MCSPQAGSRVFRAAGGGCHAVASVLSRGSKGEKNGRNCTIFTLSNGVKSPWRVSHGGVTGDLPFPFERLTLPALAPDQKLANAEIGDS